MSRKSNKPYFRWEIFVFSASEIHIVRLCTIYQRLCPPPFTDNMPPPKRPKGDFPLKLPPQYFEHFLSFLSDILVCFTHRIPKKSLFPQITPIIFGTILTSNAQQVISPQISLAISSIYLTFLFDNRVCFYTQNSKKVTFPSSCAYNIGNLFDIFG